MGEKEMEGVRKRLAERSKKNGLFVHYSLPKAVPAMTPSQIRQWARGGDVERLELIVLEGQGHRLLGETSFEPRTGNFLRTVPHVMAQCQQLHDAVSKGSLTRLQELLEAEPQRKKYALCKDAAGAGLLHKAVFYDYQDIVAWLLQNYPATVHQRDSEGRTPLHYTAACRDSRSAAARLEAAGAVLGARDGAGRTAAHYRSPALRARLALPEPPPSPPRERYSMGDMPRDTTRRAKPGLVVKPSSIRIWCHDCDLGRLQRLLWEGQGGRLRTEVSNQPVVKRFLEAVPYILNTIRDSQQAVLNNDFEALKKLTEDPVPPVLLSSKDPNNMTVLHKAAAVGNVEMVKYIGERWPQGLNDVDDFGKTPLHYAAAVKENSDCYDALISLGAEEGILDDKQKTAGYYLNRSSEMDKSAMTTLPDAPRTASNNYPATWDWKLLAMENISELNKKSRRRGKGSTGTTSDASTGNTDTLNSVSNQFGGINSSSTMESMKDLPDLNDMNESQKIEEKPKPPSPLRNQPIEEPPFIPLTELNGTHEKEDVEETTEMEELDVEQENGKAEEKQEQKEENTETEEDTSKGAEEENQEDKKGDDNQEEINEVKDENKEDKEQTEETQKDPGNTNTDGNGIEEDNNHKSSDQTDQIANELINTTDPEGDKLDDTETNEITDKNTTDESSEQKPDDNELQQDNANDENENEDDNDVQVQGEVDSEYGDSNLRSTAEASDTTSAKRGSTTNGPNTQESLIEGLVNAEAEMDSQDASVGRADDSVQGDMLLVENDEIDPEVSQLINTANMEMLAALVLNGEGARLVGRRSRNQELQAFLDNVSTYMKKINRVHVAAREGNIRDLQAALDRRKFAIARDPISPNGATPLHVATLFGKTNIIKYLGGRFPETLSAVDFEGRTALHYAAVIPDNGHYYNLLQQLGANSKDLDDNGKSAEEYHTKKELMSLNHLLEDFGVDESVKNEMLADHVPHDNVSARRKLDSPDTLSTLERCFRLLDSARSTGTRTPHSAASNRAPPPLVIGRFLRRSIFEKIKHRITKLDHDLFDVIWPAVKKLPDNKCIVQTVEEDFPGGVTAPDYYAYAVYEEFLTPLIKDLHNINAHTELGVHPPSDFNRSDDGTTTSQKDLVIELSVDSDDDFVLSGNIECSRNVAGYELPLTLSVNKLEDVERVVTAVLMQEGFSKFNNHSPESDQKGGTYYTLNEVLEKPSEVRATLAASGLLVALCDAAEIDDYDRLHGKHWPYGRGVYVSEDRTVAVWINVQDHVRVITCTPADAPGELGAPFTRLSYIMRYLHEHLEFVRDDQLGFLSSRPTFLGCGLHFNLIASFPNLSREPDNMKQLCAVRGLQYRETLSPDIVRIGNYQSVGTSESQVFNDFASATANLLQLERDLALQNSTHIATMLSNIFKRKRSSLVHDSPERANADGTNGHMDIPIFKTEEGRYLAKSLGDPLIKGLTEVANVKPKDPIAYLAGFLHNFPASEKPRLGTQESKILLAHEEADLESEQPPPLQSGVDEDLRREQPIDVVTIEPQVEPSPDAPEAAFSSANRDEHGQSMLHFAAARTHARNALFQLLQETDIGLGYRDELYRTARDVSIQANIPENTTEIDRFILHLAARGNAEKIMELLIEGYEHILDVVDEEGVPISEVVAQRGQEDVAKLLASIKPFEEAREELHYAIRNGGIEGVRAAVEAEGGRTLARGKNSFGRTALHIAVLAQNEDIVAYLAQTFPELLRLGDNLERTPLHYAMGVEKMEALSRTLTRSGAKRVLKDLKGRQPSYYFMNKSEILRLKEEEDVY